MQMFLPGTSFPNLLIYGTAWKAEKTRELVIQAFRCGFRSFDTAAQPKHYREDLVGEAIRQILAEGVVERRDLFVGFPDFFLSYFCFSLSAPIFYFFLKKKNIKKKNN